MSFDLDIFQNQIDQHLFVQKYVKRAIQINLCDEQVEVVRIVALFKCLNLPHHNLRHLNSPMQERIVFVLHWLQNQSERNKDCQTLIEMIEPVPAECKPFIEYS